MKSAYERARGYRRRAEELRTVAESLHEPAARSALQQIADDYDRMADKISRLWHGNIAIDTAAARERREPVLNRSA